MSEPEKGAGDPYAAAAASAGRLAERTGQAAHDAAVILGSGWAAAADALGTGAGGAARRPRRVPAADRARSRGGRPLGARRRHAGAGVPRPHPPVRGPPGGDGGARRADRGRRGLPGRSCSPTRRAGSATATRSGQPVLISDHLNLTGRSPLTGPPPPDGYPSRFTDLTDLYSRAAARAGPGGRPGPGRGRLRGAARPALRDPGRDPDAARGSAPTWSACPPRWRRSPRAISAPRCWRSRWSPTWRPGLAPAGLDHAEVTAAGQAAARRMGALLAGLLPGLLPGDGLT